MKKSVLQTTKECWACRRLMNVTTEEGLHRHHVFYGNDRSISEKEGLTVWLCPKHHNMSKEGVHFNQALDLELKRYAQNVYERILGHRAFMEIIGKDYLGGKE